MKPTNKQHETNWSMLKMNWIVDMDEVFERVFWVPNKSHTAAINFLCSKPRWYFTPEKMVWESLDFTSTLWWTNILPWKMAIEIVDFPIKNGDFPWRNVSSPEGILMLFFMYAFVNPLLEESIGNTFLSGWWFGTFFISIIYGIVLPIDFHIFQRGRYTTNQVLILFIDVSAGRQMIGDVNDAGIPEILTTDLG